MWAPPSQYVISTATARGSCGRPLRGATFKSALEAKVKNTVCGGDTGVFSHGENSLEMKLMV